MLPPPILLLLLLFPPILSNQLSIGIPISGDSSPNRLILCDEDGSVLHRSDRALSSLEQVLVEECCSDDDDDAYEEEEVDYEDSEDDQVSGSKFFRSPVPEGTSVPPRTPSAGF